MAALTLEWSDLPRFEHFDQERMTRTIYRRAMAMVWQLYYEARAAIEPLGIPGEGRSLPAKTSERIHRLYFHKYMNQANPDAFRPPPFDASGDGKRKPKKASHTPMAETVSLASVTDEKRQGYFCPNCGTELRESALVRSESRIRRSLWCHCCAQMLSLVTQW